MCRGLFAVYFLLVAVGCSGGKSTSNQTYVSEAQDIASNILTSDPELEAATENALPVKARIGECPQRGAIADGTSPTLLIVESSKRVPWTKPEDLTDTHVEPLTGNALRYLTAGGSVHEMSPLDHAKLQKLITRDGVRCCKVTHRWGSTSSQNRSAGAASEPERFEGMSAWRATQGNLWQVD